MDFITFLLHIVFNKDNQRFTTWNAFKQEFNRRQEQRWAREK